MIEFLIIGIKLQCMKIVKLLNKNILPLCGNASQSTHGYVHDYESLVTRSD